MREWGSDMVLPKHWEADPDAKHLMTTMVQVARHGTTTSIDLQAGGFSSDVTTDTVVPSECLIEILGPHWASNHHANTALQDKTVGNILNTMYKSYCSTVSAEFTHVQSSEQFEWLSASLETHTKPSNEERLQHYDWLVRTDTFEQFLRKKYKASKTYGLLGCEALVPGLHALCAQASVVGVEHIELGMAHRGRLSVLCNVLNKPMNTLFDEFNDDGTQQLAVSDVKYHLGARATLMYDEEDEEEGGGGGGGGRELQLSLVPNPSHLELVGPVVLGKTRAVQHFMRDKERTKAMAVLVHGDAAFSGQGITSESLELSMLPDYTTGGSIHVVINNQIGFTTDPHISRSSLHPTGNATAVGAPVFHVNGDDVDQVVRCFEMAMQYRQKFHHDCVIDVVCYRREGHNELDDPTITQPIVYSMIQKHPTTVELYTKELGRRLVTQEHETQLKDTIALEFASEYEKSKRKGENSIAKEKQSKGTRQLAKQRGGFSGGNETPETTHGALAIDETSLHRTLSNKPSDWLASNWRGDRMGDSILSGERTYNMTGVSLKTLHRIGRALGPNNIKLQMLQQEEKAEHFDLHPEVERLMVKREQLIQNNGSVDMSTGEALAMGALALPLIGDEEDSGQGGYTDHPTVHVRLSGQDSERGTFNQRHAVVVCQQTERRQHLLNGILARCWPEKEDGKYDWDSDVDDEANDNDAGSGNGNGDVGGNGDGNGVDVVNKVSSTACSMTSPNIHRRVQESVKVVNSNLSENAVLAYEYGHSLENERCLTIWEAQFGDFSNNAQAVIDNMISSGELKWKSSSGLVLLLPHGFEGQGPEHSSARVERFLQLIDDDPDAAPGFTLDTETELRQMFRQHATRKDGYGTISRHEMYDLLSQVTDIVHTGANDGGHSGRSVPDARGQTLLLKEILNSNTLHGQVLFTEMDFIKYSTTWIRRNYESNYNMSVVNATSPAVSEKIDLLLLLLVVVVVVFSTLLQNKQLTVFLFFSPTSAIFSCSSSANSSAVRKTINIINKQMAAPP